MKNLEKRKFRSEQREVITPLYESLNTDYKRLDTGGKNALDTGKTEQHVEEGIIEQTIEGLQKPNEYRDAVNAQKEGWSLNAREVIGHESASESQPSENDLQATVTETDNSEVQTEKKTDKYELNPYKLTDKSRADTREGIMNGDIGEADIRKIGEPLRKRYNELSEEALNKLLKNEERRKELIRDEIYSKSYDELTAIKDQLQALRRNDTEIMLSYTPIKNMEKALSEARPIGPAENDAGQIFLNDSDESAKRAIEVINDVRTRLPTDWVEKSNTEPILAQHAPRGYFIKNDGISTIALSTGRGMERCAYHELGHHFEELYPEIRKLEHEFYNRRTAGEYSRWLGPPYPLKEKYRPDQFTSGYMGKDYGNTEESGYEILSMGMEGLYTGSHKLHKDTEYQDFVFGILASI